MIQAIHSKKYHSPLMSKTLKSNEHSGDSTDKEHKIIEDTMVSSILGTLFLLPDHLIWQILDESTGKRLSQLDKDLLTEDINNIEFWPKWDCSEIPEIKNEIYVEPDVVLHLPNEHIVIIEAKRDISNKQKEEQWCNEILSANHRRYQVDLLIALDGNENISEECVEDTIIIKITWQMLYHTIESHIAKNLNATRPECKSIMRILNQTIMAFRIFGYFPMLYLNTLAEINISDEATKFFAKNKI